MEDVVQDYVHYYESVVETEQLPKIHICGKISGRVEEARRTGCQGS